MKIKPKVARTTPIGATVQNVKVRYDPVEHADGLPVPDDLGRALVKTGHWVEVQSLPKVLEVAKDKDQRLTPRDVELSTFVDIPEDAPHDGFQS